MTTPPEAADEELARARATLAAIHCHVKFALARGGLCASAQGILVAVVEECEKTLPQLPEYHL